MAGHSHWANIAYKKAAIDRKRGRIFSKLARKVIAAAKAGGPDPDSNLRLANAIADARAANMSNDQIQRAIQRGAGATGGENWQELLYEGYAAGGAAVLVEGLTDNRNRTSGELRQIFDRHGGRMGEAGSVAWKFARKAVVRVPKEGTTEDALMAAVLDAGADDLEDVGEAFQVVGSPDTLAALREAVAAAGLTPSSAEVSWVPTTYLPVDAAHARQIAALLEALEENDDVQKVHTNAEFPDDFDG